MREFATRFRAAFPDLAFGGTADLIAEGDYVVGQWIGGGTHTGDPMTDLPMGGLPEPSTGKTMRFTGTTILKVENGLITEEVGLDDGVSRASAAGPDRRGLIAGVRARSSLTTRVTASQAMTGTVPVMACFAAGGRHHIDDRPQ